jgi:hypothetical protein
MEQLENADTVFYCPKVSKKERNAGLDEFEDRRIARGSSNNLKQWINGDREFNELDEKSKDFCTIQKNPHPTCKPISLIKYLASLLLPPDVYGPERRIMVPFAGVASEMIGSMLAGWDIVQGIEIGGITRCNLVILIQKK